MNKTGNEYANLENKVIIKSTSPDRDLIITCVNRDKNINIYSEKGYVSLGRKNAEESVLLGDRFIDQFIQLLNSLESLANALITEPQLAGTPQVASLVKTNIQSIKVNISGSNVLSNFVKVS